MFTPLVTVYQYIVIVMDFVHLVAHSVLICLSGMWHFFYPPKLKSLSGEIALVTGTGHGIGKQLALQLARKGAKVICMDINEGWNQQTVSQIKKEGGVSYGICCDVSNKEDVGRTTRKIKDTIGNVTLIINNAGIMPCKSFTKHTTEEIDRIFRVNVLSQFWILHEWLPSMMANRKGHIVGISSICGIVGAPNLVPYNSTKFAIRGLIEGLTEELRYGDVHSCIKLTRVHPYHVDTGLGKHKRIRFPSLNPVLSAENCAETIITGIRRNEEVIFVPKKDFYIFKFMEILPRKIQQAIMDFVDTGIDAEE